MPKFEEEAVNCWYALRGYLTARNIVYVSPTKRPGGKGRGEIDLLALKVDAEGKPEDRVRVEVGVSIAGRFPWIDKKGGADETRKLLERLLSRGADEKAREYFGTNEYRNQFITSEFASNACSVLKNRIEELKRSGEFNVEVIRVEGDEPKILLKVKNDPKDIEMELSGVREAEILPFSYVIKQLTNLFKEKGLAHKGFSDPIMRAIQYIVRIQESTPGKG